MKYIIKQLISILAVFNIIFSGLPILNITVTAHAASCTNEPVRTVGLYAAKVPDPAELRSQYKARELIDRYQDPDTARDTNAFLSNFYSGGLKKITRSQLAELEAVGRDAVKGYETDREKIHRIYEYVARNFFYKKDHNGPSNVYDAWKLKYGVCQDYAALCKLFLNAAGIPCIVVHSSRPDEEAHAYNAAYDSRNKRWIYFDATGGSNNQYDNTYWVGQSPGSGYGDLKKTSWFEAETYDDYDFDFSAEEAAVAHYHGITTIKDLSDGTFLYSVATYDSKNQRSLWFSSDEWTLTVTGIKPGSGTSAVISAELAGVPVTTIGSKFAKEHYPELKEITIPASVDTIYQKAFAGKYPMTLIFEGTVNTIQTRAFDNESAMTLVMKGDPPVASKATAFDHMADGSIVYFPCTNPKWTDEVVDSFDVYFPGPDLIRDHDRNSIVSEKAATASEDGYIEYECSKCGKTYREIIPAAGRNDDESEKPSDDDGDDDDDDDDPHNMFDEDEIDYRINPADVSVKNRTFRKSALKRSAKTYKAITVKHAEGQVTYKVKGGDTKVLALKKGGRITIKKGTKKGTYKLKVRVTAKGSEDRERKIVYISDSQIVTVKVRIR